MKKTIIFAVILTLLLSMFTLTASAKGFDPNGQGVSHVTGYDYFKYANEGSMMIWSQSTEAEVTSPNMYYIEFLLESYGYAYIDYICSPNPQGSPAIWDNYLAYEHAFYSAEYYVLEIKNNSDVEVGVSPVVIAFDSNGGTSYIGVTGNDADYPILLSDYNGNVTRAETVYSVDRYLVTLPANFAGYVVIPYDRMTSDIINEDATIDGDIMDYYDAGYRFFWSLGLFVENFGDEEATVHYVNVFVANDQLEITVPSQAPTQAPTNTPTQAPTDTPSTQTPSTQTPSTQAPSTTDVPTQIITDQPTGDTITDQPTDIVTNEVSVAPTEVTTTEASQDIDPTPTQTQEQKKSDTVWVNLTYFIIFIVIAVLIIAAEAVVIFMLIKKLKAQNNQ